MDNRKETRFTEKQGQYLAFIYNYVTLHGRPPAERELQQFFGTTPPSIHQMILKLEERRLISRVPGHARSIRLMIPAEDLPVLKPRTGNTSGGKL
jgi:SOS-response transcriptional repressor LexA